MKSLLIILLAAAVRRVLAPAMNKQWDYDAAVERLKTTSAPVP